MPSATRQKSDSPDGRSPWLMFRLCLWILCTLLNTLWVIELPFIMAGTLDGEHSQSDLDVSFMCLTMFLILQFLAAYLIPLFVEITEPNQSLDWLYGDVIISFIFIQVMMLQCSIGIHQWNKFLFDTFHRLKYTDEQMMGVGPLLVVLSMIQGLATVVTVLSYPWSYPFVRNEDGDLNASVTSPEKKMSGRFARYLPTLGHYLIGTMIISVVSNAAIAKYYLVPLGWGAFSGYYSQLVNVCLFPALYLMITCIYLTRWIRLLML